jgi:hypothetical protein
MAISSAVCTSFKVELLKGVHNFSASGGNTFRIALYTSSASLGAGTTAYSTSNEISNTSGSAYVAKGAAFAVIAFGGDKTVSSGTFTIQFPTADASNAIIRLA